MATLVEQISLAFTRVGRDVKSILLGLAGKLDSSLLGAPNGVAGLDSTGKLPSAVLPDSLLGAMRYQGTWDASTNTPTMPAASSSNRGHYYVVSVAGSTSIDGINEWKVTDWIVSNGTAYNKVDSTDQVSSVAGRQGAVVLTKSDVGLANVDNTSDANKPVSSAQQTALNLKANLVSPTFTGTPTAPSQTYTDSSTRLATTSFVKSVTGDPDTNFITAYESGLNG